MGTPNKRTLLWVGGATFAIIAALIAAYAIRGGSRPAAAERPSASPSASKSGLQPDQAQVEALQGDLTSGDPKRVAAAMGAGGDLNPEFADQLARLKPISIDMTGLRVEGDGVVTTTATVGPATDRKSWNVRLALVDGRWILATTEPRES